MPRLLSPSLRRAARATPLFRALRPRRAHLVCLGAEKTGTSSVAAAFVPAYRSAHEPDVGRVVPLAVGFERGEVTWAEAVRVLRAHDRAHWLEVESSHPLGAVAGPLCEAWPEARVLITLREPRAWLASRCSWTLRAGRDRAEPWRTYDAHFFSAPAAYPPEEAALERRGLPPLDVYLHHYRRRYETLLDGVPAERRLVVRTRELSGAFPRIAAFAGLPPDAARPAWVKRRRRDDRPLSGVDEGYLAARVAAVCGPVYARAEAAL